MFWMYLRSSTEALVTLRSYCYSNDHYATLMQSFKLLPHTCGCVHTASGVCSTGCEVKGVKFLRVVVYSMSIFGYARLDSGSDLQQLTDFSKLST